MSDVRPEITESDIARLATRLMYSVTAPSLAAAVLRSLNLVVPSAEVAGAELKAAANRADAVMHLHSRVCAMSFDMAAYCAQLEVSQGVVSPQDIANEAVIIHEWLEDFTLAVIGILAEDGLLEVSR